MFQMHKKSDFRQLGFPDIAPAVYVKSDTNDLNTSAYKNVDNAAENIFGIKNLKNNSAETDSENCTELLISTIKKTTFRNKYEIIIPDGRSMRNRHN